MLAEEIAPAPDQTKLEELTGAVFQDVGALFTAPLVVLGDRLGLYAALRRHGPASPAELAELLDMSQRYLKEWLSAQAAAGYIDYNPDNERFSMSAEQAALFADAESPTFFIGAFEVATALGLGRPRLEEAFRSGEGVGWHEHDHMLFCGTERFFRSGYSAHLLSDWLPALDGVVAKLERGGKVADIGCGHGASTLILAKAFPNSRFIGFDYHEESIAAARQAAEDAGLAGRVRFEVATASDYPGKDYDLACMFDALHDMGDPVGAARHVRETLAPDGNWMIVEPFANDRLEDNLNPVGRVFYAASTMACTPGSLAQEVGLALGAQAGEARLRDVLKKAGFNLMRRATETPFNIVLEARP